VPSEFTTLLIRVMVVGGAIGFIGAGVLLLAFRSAGRFRSTVLIATLLAFVFLCCMLLLRISF